MKEECPHHKMVVGCFVSMVFIQEVVIILSFFQHSSFLLGQEQNNTDLIEALLTSSLTASPVLTFAS